MVVVLKTTEQQCSVGSNPTPSAINRTPNVACSVCDKKIYRRPSQVSSFSSFYCSLKCCGVSQRSGEKVCPACDRKFHSPAASKRVSCSRSCSNKMRKGVSYKVGAPADKAKVISRLKVALAKERGGRCEDCGNINFAILHVHHIVERANGGSDDLSNLRLLCPNCHSEGHHGVCTYEEFLAQSA